MPLVQDVDPQRSKTSFDQTTLDNISRLARWVLALPIAPAKRSYLGFRYGDELFQFRALPFGLNVAPRIFKIISHAVAEMSKKQVCLPYLDDLLIVADSERSAEAIRR